MCWYRQYREESWLTWYRREFDGAFRRAFDDPEDARGTAIYRMLYEKLPAANPKHRDNLDAYVRGMFRNLLRDMTRELRGRPRPPSKMALLGEPIVGIFYKFCLERKPPDIIAAESALDELSVREWVRWLKANRKCPERTTSVSLDGAEEGGSIAGIELSADARPDPVGADIESEEAIGMGEWLLELAGAGESGDARARAVPSEAVRHRLAEMREAMSTLLSDEDRILLGLRYREGLGTTSAAAAMELPAHTLRRREKALLGKVRELFVSYGLES